MKKSKQIYDEVYKELTEEFGIKNINEKTGTLDEIEGMVGKFGREFERRVIEKIIEDQREKIDKKKAVKNVIRNSKILECEKKK